MSVTDRQRRALFLLCEYGWTVEQVAAELGRHPRTIKRDLANARRATDTATSAAAYVRLAARPAHPRRRRPAQRGEGLFS